MPQAGNAWTLALGKQSAKGTPQTTPTARLRYTGGFGPVLNRNMITLAETDASRQEGDPIVVGLRVEGTSEHYIRPDEYHRFADLLLGSTATTGATNYTHTSSSTVSGSAPYATLYKNLGSGALVDRYSDCQISSHTARGGAEQVLTCTNEWLGLVALMNQTDPGTPTVTSDRPLVYPDVTVTIAGVTTAIVSSFEVTVNQNRSQIIGDTGLSAGDNVAGLFGVSGSLEVLFENDDDYAEFHTGTTSGTTPGTVIASKSLNILAQENVNRSVAWDMDNIIITAYPLEGNTDGAPLRVAIAFRSKRGATLANNLEIITKNQTAGPV
jgi:hypothetical protein